MWVDSVVSHLAEVLLSLVPFSGCRQTGITSLTRRGGST